MLDLGSFDCMLYRLCRVAEFFDVIMQIAQLLALIYTYPVQSRSYAPIISGFAGNLVILFSYYYVRRIRLYFMSFKIGERCFLEKLIMWVF